VTRDDSALLMTINLGWEWAIALLVLFSVVFGRRIFYFLTSLPALSLTPSVSRKLSWLVKTRHYSEDDFFAADGAPVGCLGARRQALRRLSAQLSEQRPQSEAWAEKVRGSMSDLRFADANRVPFPFARVMAERFNLCSVANASSGPRLQDLDGNWTLDISGSYGVNVAGYDLYKKWVTEGQQKVSDLGPVVLGPLHPIVSENIKLLQQLSGQQEVSFHMSGTEAVMAAIRLARFNTRRKKVVCFAGAYHGWWDGVQPGLGSERPVDDVLTFKEMSAASLRAIRLRARDIAGIVVNPVQSFHPNSPPPNDAVLLTSDVRKIEESTSDYQSWLKALRRLCDECDIPLLFDEVYSGFRLAPGGAQEYFGVQADMVMYGKTLGGGMPVGVVCGKQYLMRRFDPERPLRLAYVVGTFSAHPVTMGTMNAFLQWVSDPARKADYENINQRCDRWAESTNQMLRQANVPISVVNLGTVWTVEFNQPGRYSWLLQYYLRAEGVNLSWVGTGRCAMSFDLEEDDYRELQIKLRNAAVSMKADKWWLSTDEQPNRNQIIKTRLIKEMMGSILKMPNSAQNFYAEVMQRKHDDHIASHNHPTNQFFHLISSSLFICCYIAIFFDLVTAMWIGLASLILRQAGHALIEPPCHDEEQLLLGFDTRSKTIIVIGFLMIPAVNLLLATELTWAAFSSHIATNIAMHWFYYTAAVVLYRVFLLIFKHGIYLSMIWFIKLITDPLTDIRAYYRSVFNPVKRRA